MSAPRTCAHCDGPMPTVTAAMRKYAGQRIDQDPYCSAMCCRNAHGVQPPTLPAMSTTPVHAPPARGLTRLQQERLEASARRKAEVEAELAAKGLALTALYKVAA